ncbi:hypothetical protein A8E25_33390 [Burkholderia cenocepacia]|nr:hypothetical protein A8E25_33390 [Burkholderia cenocepacia]ONS81053.1 hypothetical protein A8E31_21405 [Burkholderia cenocepacia]
MIGLAISSVSVVPMPEVNSSPRKLTAPPGLFETVSYYAPDAYRSSDHDPVVIDVALDDPAAQPAPGTNRAHR